MSKFLHRLSLWVEIVSAFDEKGIPLSYIDSHFIWNKTKDLCGDWQ